MFAAIPLLALPVLFYNVFMFAFGPGSEAQARMDQTLFTIPMASHVRWIVHTSDLFMLSSLIILFIELLRSTRAGRLAIINHSLSMVLFIGCLVEFLLRRACATSTFFLITTMVLLDVLAGFIVTLASGRREIDIHR